MKRRAVLFLLILLSLPPIRLHCADAPNPSGSTAPRELANAVVEQRIAAAIGRLLDHVNQDALKRGDTAMTFVLGSLFANRNVAEANRFLLDYCQRTPVSREPKIMALRYPITEFCIYLNPVCRPRLTPEAKAALEERAWNYVFFRSRLSAVDRNIGNGRWEGGFNTQMSEWNLSGSENHQADWTATNFLALAILRQAGAPYGPQATLGDGSTVEAHYYGWEGYWLRYFRSHAREGLDCEVAHPSSYGRATLHAYYALEDFSESPALKNLATSFLDLYWANVASEFEPRTGIRSACASTRCYKGTWQQLGSIYWAAPLLLAYDWWTPAEGVAGRHAEPQFDLMAFYTSTYRPPAILQQIASDTHRPPYQATSRRFGRGNGAAAIDRMIVFDDGAAGNSYIRRDVYYTPDYTISALTFDAERTYVESVRQSRVMGITFSQDVNARILVYGEARSGKNLKDAETEHKQINSAAVNGLCGPGVLIGGRDPKASETDGVRLFVSSDLWKNRAEGADGWLFTRLGDAYGAVRIAAGGYETKPAPTKTGVFLQLKDIWAPVVIQMGRAADYKTFADFQTAVQAEKFSYTDGTLSCVSLAGDNYQFSTKTTALPLINGQPLNLNPSKTYDMPCVTMEHGSDMATISYAGSKPLVLDFSPPAR